MPNVNHLCWKIGAKKGTEQVDINERLLSLGDWKHIFNERGLEVLKVHQDRWPFRRIRVFSSMNPFAVVKTAVCKFAGFMLPLNYAYQFIFIMREKERNLPENRDSSS